MKTAEEYIESITLDKANLQYIADNLVINGSLLVSLRKAMQGYAKECCKEQRDICASVYNHSTVNFSNRTISEIKNAPEPEVK
jgi:hypothetical protein